ncbi:MAG: sigma-70 family RNA polymerase sigma factor [Acidobacteriota bacterium]
MRIEKSEGISLSALESVVARNSGRWFRFLMGILKNEADAEDAMQEAVRRVLVRNRSFPSEEQVKLYLGRAIGNTAFELYNTRKRERIRSTTIQESIVAYEDSIGPDDEIERKEEIHRNNAMLGLLEKGLRQLPIKQEEALRMTILESAGRSMREIGLRNNIPYSTLRHRHKKGLQRMRKYLERAVDTSKV